MTWTVRAALRLISKYVQRCDRGPEGTVDAAYFQFYLQGRGDVFDDSGGDDETEAHLVGVDGGAIVLTLGHSGPTPIRMEAWPEAPADAIDDHWEHVVEVSFATDGLVRVLSWPDEIALEIPVPSGGVRARVHWEGLTEDADRMNSESDDPDEGDDDDEEVRSERLLVQVWPAPERRHQVLRWWSGWVLPPTSAATAEGRRQLDGNERVVATYSRFLRIPVELSEDDQSNPPAELGLRSAFRLAYDPDEGTWWLEGHHHRIALVELAESEARDLVSRGRRTMARLVAGEDATLLETPNFAGEGDLQVVSAGTIDAMGRVGLAWAAVLADAVPSNEPTWDEALEVLAAMRGENPAGLDLAQRLRGRWEGALALWAFPFGMVLCPQGSRHPARSSLHITWGADNFVVSVVERGSRQDVANMLRADLEPHVIDSLKRLMGG